MYNSVKQTKVQLSEDIFPVEAWELISNNMEGDNVVIIDVSTPQEYKDLRLGGAINVNLLSRFFKSRLDVMNKNKTYVVYCKVGGRSKIAQKLMQQIGFRTVYNIVGGTLLWEEEGLPFAPGTDGVNKFSFCPLFISIITFKKIKKVLQSVLSRIEKKPYMGANHFYNSSGSFFKNIKIIGGLKCKQKKQMTTQLKQKGLGLDVADQRILKRCLK